MFIIDYLSFTINKEGMSFVDVLDVLNIGKLEHDFYDLGSLRRYEHCFKYGNINISTPFPHLSEMGYYVDMSGQGCREYEDLFSDLLHQYDWSLLFKRLIHCVNTGYKVNVTRIDLAFDDFDGVLKIPSLLRKLRAGDYVSRFKGWSEIKSEIKHSKTAQKGFTVYIGSKSSNCFCKFYDKKAEMLEKHLKDPSIFEKVEAMKHWVRYEITFKDINAMSVCNMIAFNDTTGLLDHVNGCFHFVERTSTRCERCGMAKFWGDFIGSNNANRVRNVLSDLKGYDPAMQWFNSAVVPTAYAIMQTFGSDKAFTDYIKEVGSKKQHARHKLITLGKTKGGKLTNRELWKENNPCDFSIRWKKIQSIEYKPFHGHGGVI